MTSELPPSVTIPPKTAMPVLGVENIPVPVDVADFSPSFRTALRVLRPIVGDAAIHAAGTAAPLERMQLRSDPPTVSACDAIEAPAVRRVQAARATTVAAFLDGIQRSRVIGHVHGSPLVFGSVAAVIRQREQRRLETWDVPRVQHALYASRAELGDDTWSQLEASGLPLRDVAEAKSESDMLTHPLAVRGRALEQIAYERERLERALAAEWCRREQRWLWIDGGISGNPAVDEHASAFGVVKSHRTLYGTPSVLRAVLTLREAERSPTFLVVHRARRAVVSWYLRLRETASGDPLHGLVRVEVAPSMAVRDALHLDDHTRDIIGAQATLLSSWILAERRPLSLPDPRWDTLTYGVHACEMYLKALVGA